MRAASVMSLVAWLGCLPVAACAQTPAPAPLASSVQAPVLPAAFNMARPPHPEPKAAAPGLHAADPVVNALASELRRSVPVAAAGTGQTRAALDLAETLLRATGRALPPRRAVLVVDRSPQVQRLWVTVTGAPGAPWEVLGAVRVSTGKPGRKEHFRTPVGVFVNDGSVLGYRAQGTYNENHIRGIGTKGMRVWDFGWQTTDDWRTPGALMGVRLEMHATDPDVLEPRLGRWDSEGCIRIPTKFDVFLDHTGLIDATLTDAARTEKRFAALLPKDAAPSPLAGTTVIVVDTSEPGARVSDPVRANAMEHPAALLPGHDDAG